MNLLSRVFSVQNVSLNLFAEHYPGGERGPGDHFLLCCQHTYTKDQLGGYTGQHSCRGDKSDTTTACSGQSLY